MSDSGDYDGSIVTVLHQVRLTADLQGLAIVDLTQDAADAPVAYCLGDAGADTIERGRALLVAIPDRPTDLVGADNRPLIACPWTLPPARPGGLLLWRAAGSPAWTDAERALCAALAMLLRTVIGAGMGQIGIDRLTGIPNRRWFLDETDRHIDRLDRDATVGTLTLIDIDDLRRVNHAAGRPEGDRMLVRMADQLRAMVRPGDLVARVGADEFAVWQSGMDHLTAAERADSLCRNQAFQDGPDGRGVKFSIGIASRLPGSGEDVRAVLRRAHMAAREVKANGGGGWRVGRVEPLLRRSGP
ncbi:GGDEF domain-containing protein [Rhodopila sp.]|uniref:GGDEF domain-containing protein n=1 Tax=Rhodopila sp. TaxID=2480087 RepID=UPI003D0D4941